MFFNMCSYMHSSGDFPLNEASIVIFSILLHDQFPGRDISGLRIFRGYSCNKYCFVALLLLHVVCEIGLNFHHSFAFIASIFVCVRNRSFTEHISRNYTGQAY